mgnify:CR=1 FL=1
MTKGVEVHVVGHREDVDRLGQGVVVGEAQGDVHGPLVSTRREGIAKPCAGSVTRCSESAGEVSVTNETRTWPTHESHRRGGHGRIVAFL